MSGGRSSRNRRGYHLSYEGSKSLSDSESEYWVVPLSTRRSAPRADQFNFARRLLTPDASISIVHTREAGSTQGGSVSMLTNAHTNRSRVQSIKVGIPGRYTPRTHCAPRYTPSTQPRTSRPPSPAVPTSISQFLHAPQSLQVAQQSADLLSSVPAFQHHASFVPHPHHELPPYMPAQASTASSQIVPASFSRFPHAPQASQVAQQRTASLSNVPASQHHAPFVPSGPGSLLTMSEAGHGLVGAHAPPNPGPSKEFRMR